DRHVRPRATPHHLVLTRPRPLRVLLGTVSIVLAVIPVLDPFRDVARQIEGPVRSFASWIAADGLEEIVGELGHLTEQSERGVWLFLPPGKRPLIRPSSGFFPLGFGR